MVQMMLQETVHIEGPYDFDQVLKRHSMDPMKKLNLEKRSIFVPIVLGNNSCVVEVTAIGTVDRPAFIITSHQDADKEQVIHIISEIFQWDLSLIPINKHFGQTDLKEIFTQFYGTPLVLDFDPFSSIIKCIIHQQLNMTFAYTLTDRLVKNFGYNIDGVWFFPQPEALANITVARLRELQFSTRKAEYVIDLAKAVSEGSLNLQKIKDLSDEEIFETMIKIRGIGKWTIENFLLFGLGRPNLFPMADIGIQNALKKLYQLEKKPTFEEMEQYKQGWEPYLSYASLYLWRSIENLE
jgi:DNA-3-methyladenine glycosylase II